MNNFEMKWVESNNILKSDRAYQVRQVYVWAMDKNKEFLIVSKDGNNWQLPGGKPDTNEPMVATACREMLEETGVNISDRIRDLDFFGYYKVRDLSTDSHPFLQVRFALDMQGSNALNYFHTRNEDHNQQQSETIKHIRLVDGAEAVQLIPWLSSSGEYKYLKLYNLI
ncbi:MAG: NUDIX hydrolase [bacterium]